MKSTLKMLIIFTLINNTIKNYILELEDDGNPEIDINEEGKSDKKVASQPKNPITQATFKGKWCRTNVKVHEIPITRSGQRKALNLILDSRVKPTLTLLND